MKNQIIFLSVFFLFSTVLSGCNPSEETIFYENRDLPQISGSVLLQEEAVEETADDMIYVSIQGSVESPGVYKMPVGSRVYELINLAGGIVGTADTRGINMVTELTDGTQLFIPSLEEESWNTVAASAGLNETSSGLVNINTAGLDELMTLNGIGETRAKAIIAYREKGNSFEKIEDIMNVNGIKNGIYEGLKDQICVR
ncbi:MAG: helix-hairpin-helix domain-containing protein [Lachnospiraceae bacterium]|nr:helix-hairpin-helix domain-containing protein [Lachnospiraceae bacterium]